MNLWVLSYEIYGHYRIARNVKKISFLFFFWVKEILFYIYETMLVIFLFIVKSKKPYKGFAGPVQMALSGLVP